LPAAPTTTSTQPGTTISDQPLDISKHGMSAA
jgi:hypothetical protein